MMKIKLLIIASAMAIALNAHAQEKNKIRYDTQPGVAVFADGATGILGNGEIKWNITDKMNVGIRLSTVAARSFLEIEDSSVPIEPSSRFNLSLMATYDYYFHKGSSSFAPFVGGGIGYVLATNIDTDSFILSLFLPLLINRRIISDNIAGGFVRGGFEWRKLRLAVEYNFIPQSSFNLDDSTQASVRNSYFGASIGFYLGGGNWGR